MGVWKKVVWRLREGEWSEEEKTRYGVRNVTKKLMERVRHLYVLGVVIRVQVQLQSKLNVVSWSNNNLLGINFVIYVCGC